MSGDRDTGYKLLFSHPEMVRDLLVGYVPGEWIAQADFSTLERINSSYVSQNLKHRHDDVVWRVRLADRWLWVYLVLEFQSRPDPWMALRMMVYLGLLAQDIVNRKELADGMLPPILPLVLYNGVPEWQAAIDVAELFAPSPRGLECFRPRLPYRLIDEARLKRHPLESVRNAVDALFQLEHSRGPEDLRRVLQALGTMLADEAMQPLRRTLNIWIKSLLRRKTPAKPEEIDAINDLMEANTMLAERIEGWFAKAERKGKREGRLEGKREGEIKGKLEGKAQALHRLLERRFGALSAEVAGRIASASVSQVETWFDRAIDATTLEDVFRNH